MDGSIPNAELCFKSCYFTYALF